VRKKRFASVWDAIEDTPEKAENMKLRSSLMIAPREHMAGTGLSQAPIAKPFGVTQPRVSDLMRGKIDVFGLDALVNMAAAAGLHVKLSVEKQLDLLAPGYRTAALVARPASLGTVVCAPEAARPPSSSSWRPIGAPGLSHSQCPSY
jgi:predicted XRE-type DNA-binding protein